LRTFVRLPAFSTAEILVALPSGFVYVATIRACSRLIVGYATGRAIDARLTVAASRATIERRRPPPG
jgi:putative transposase